MAASAASAAPEPGAAYGDHMVFQRGQPIIVEGTSAPGATVTGALGSERASATADRDGVFRLTFAAREASSDPLTLTLSDSDGETTLSDLLIGDVWLCSGQSNMELSVARALNTWNELRMSADDEMRLFMVPKHTAAAPQRAFGEPVEWAHATPDTVEPFSAACFYMGKKLRADTGVPVGLIHSNWGGSAVSAWFTPDGVRETYGQAAIDQLQLYDSDPFAAAQAFVPQWYDWWREGTGGSEPWADTDSLDWQVIPKFSFWNEWEGTGLDTAPEANIFFRQSFTLTAEQAAGDGTVSIGAIDDIDLTWVNGNPVGYTFGWGVERTYHVPAAYLREGENEVLIAASNNWDTGGFYGTPDRLFVTTGNGDTVPLAEDWEYSVGAISEMPPRAPWDAIAGLGVMHNYMIAPIGPMRLAGVAWYQGESDVGPEGYDDKLATLFAGWREQFGEQARMLVVQLADYGQRVSQPVESGWADLREEQRQGVLADGNAALVTAIDLGEPSDIHPANKNVLGLRLAMAARGEALPMPDRAQRGGNAVAVTFTGVEGGLTAYGGPYPLGVELCGDAPGSCRYASAVVHGSSLLIPLDGEPATRVRYAWSDAPVVNLYDGRDIAVPGFELEIE
ncbi:sialate O-acetylesterase [Alteraurantiacibacter aquimixticola]|uniref:Sialate O-acetylesterase n=2 Tax=Alteraurantiacibacter aquimixticola TaxID=2489173 RepID=A0A4T3F459_9SPHN|nr:sialate O-acetylesterase [Alteraurantiacibacter aquimixticola]